MVVLMASVVKVGFRQTTLFMQERRLYRRECPCPRSGRENRDAEQRHEHSGAESCRRPCGLHTAWSTPSEQADLLVSLSAVGSLQDWLIFTWHGFPISSFSSLLIFSASSPLSVLSPPSPFQTSGPLVLQYQTCSGWTLECAKIQICWKCQVGLLPCGA